ncbi:MAG: glycosyltransferase family 1 protein [Candidatus Auribacter fodinae]|jgi:glycosyltransferase involved in cell wall biosynthesis|uniref:Glycosyltransferase family 1 protein n=1 Tax=Candidatus Auribacter fodinae TaxID=2093366 RepID=A0A3A4R6U5_9BACT|nr:MAG: glycosyltransferase family 1 protein [Candidatus Auribacter fodinae]
MRVALFRELPLDFPGGVTHVMTLLIDYLVKNGHEVLLFVPDAGSISEYHGAEVFTIDSYQLPLLKNTQFKLAKMDPQSVKKKLVDFNPDIVQVLHPVTLGLVGLSCANDLNIPVVCSYHTQYHLYLDYYKLSVFKPLLWWYTKWMFNKCAIALSPAESVARMMRDGGIKNVHIWGRGADSNLFSPEHRSTAWRKRFIKNPDEKIILYVGRLYKEKNLRRIVSTIKDLRNAQFVFIGDGPEREFLSSAIPDGKAHFTGRLTGKDLSTAFASADIFLFPSRTEGCPNSVMEAVSSGLPVVGVEAYGVSDIVTEGQCGYLYTHGDEGAILSLVQRLIDDDAIRSELSINARNYALRKSWDTIMESLIQNYQSVMSSAFSPKPTIIMSPAPAAIVDN